MSDASNPKTFACLRASYWLLPGQETPGNPSPDSELERWFAEMEKQFPPRTPLDEDDRESAGD